MILYFLQCHLHVYARLLGVFVFVTMLHNGFVEMLHCLSVECPTPNPFLWVHLQTHSASPFLLCST